MNIRGERFRLASSATILLMFVISLLAVNRAGVAARVYHTTHGISERELPVALVRRTTDVYAYWKEKGVKNRIVVHLGRFLHFVELDPYQGYKTVRKFPLRAESLLPEYEAKLSYLNFLWAAIETDIAREVYNVLPPAAFREKVAEIAQAEGVWRRSGGTYMTQYYGSLRVIAGDLPREREPVLLNVDASFFATTDPERFVTELRGSGLSVDIVTLCLSEDSPDVTPAERERLLKVADLLNRRD